MRRGATWDAIIANAVFIAVALNSRGGARHVGVVGIAGLAWLSTGQPETGCIHTRGVDACVPLLAVCVGSAVSHTGHLSAAHLSVITRAAIATITGWEALPMTEDTAAMIAPLELARHR